LIVVFVYSISSLVKSKARVGLGGWLGLFPDQEHNKAGHFRINANPRKSGFHFSIPCRHQSPSK
jgi:hypothetical protein